MDTVKLFGRCKNCSIPNRMCRIKTSLGEYPEKNRLIPYEFCFAKSRYRAALYSQRPVPVKTGLPVGASADKQILGEMIETWEKNQQAEELEWKKVKWVI